MFSIHWDIHKERAAHDDGSNDDVVCLFVVTPSLEVEGRTRFWRRRTGLVNDPLVERQLWDYHL